MGLLTEAKLDEVVERGCSGCGKRALEFHAVLDARIPILGGEPVGKITWVYDGEKFVDGVYAIVCVACREVAFSSEICPRCHSSGALARVLEENNRWPVPTSCKDCGAEEVRYVAMVPARVVYEGKRAEKPRTQIELYDPGFHGMRVECVDCGVVAECDNCALCGAEGPIRPRP